jgi:branched-chain amino acid aminotransferase
VPTRVYVDGSIAEEQAAVVPVFDRGFLYGDSVYEVARTSGGRVVDGARHLERLGRSAAAILLPLPPPAEIAAAIAATLAAAANPESYLRVMVTRGSGEYGLDPGLADRPRLVVIVRPLQRPPEILYRDGASVALVGPRQERSGPGFAVGRDPAVKSGNYISSVIALAAARRAGCYEPILCNLAGDLVEGASSNIFVVRGGALATPPLADGLLDGITRRRVMEICAADGLPVAEAHLRPDDLRGADEAFLTSSVRGVMPVVRVEETPIRDGHPGPITARVMGAYAAFLARVAAGAEA